MPIRPLVMMLMLCGTVSAACGPGAATAQLAVSVPLPVMIPRDTPVVLLATREIRSDSAAVGTLFPLRVQQAVATPEGIVIPVGTPAFGQVVSAEGSGSLGKNGTMEVKLRYIQLGEARIPIEGDKASNGVGAGSAGMAVLFMGVAGLFHRGNNARIKAGELLSGFVSEDVTVDLAAMPVRRLEATAAVPAPAIP